MSERGIPFSAELSFFGNCWWWDGEQTGCVMYTAASDDVKISGKFTDKKYSGMPIAGIKLEFSSSSGNRSCLTSEDGTYFISFLHSFLIYKSRILNSLIFLLKYLHQHVYHI